MIEKNSFHFKKTKNPYLEKISKIWRGMYPFLENFLSAKGNELMKEEPILQKLSKWLRVSRPYLQRF
jgi:hypothetical protein